MRISDWSSDVCSSDLSRARSRATTRTGNFPTPTRREVKRASGGLALAAHVAACSGGIVPQGEGPSSAGSSATPPRLDYNVTVRQQIGRASCGERVCQYGKITACDVAYKKKKQTHNNV